MKKTGQKNIRDILGLAPMQEGILFHYLKAPGGNFYFAQLCLEIAGQLDIQRFIAAWNFVVKTNEMLRTCFRWEKVKEPIQIILKESTLELHFYDVPGKTPGEKANALAEIKKQDRIKGFDLTNIPFRITLCRMDDALYQIIISHHHILYDGWSSGIILKEFFKAYHMLCKGEPLIKPPVKTPFKEFIKWTQNQDRNKQQYFWRKYLAGLETATELSIKRRLEETKRVEGESYSKILEEDIRGRLEVFVKNNRVTLAAVFYTAWGILLQKYCDSVDVIFGTTVSGRSAGVKGIGDMVGLFINTLPLRVQAAPGIKVIDVLTRIENLLREREEFENTPLVDIRDYSPVAGSGFLFDTIVAIENYPLDSRLIPEGSLLSVHSYSLVEMPHYDLSVGIMLFNEIEIKFSFKRELFDKEAIENLVGHFKIIVKNIVENPGSALSRLEIISIEEKKRVLYEFNDTAVEYPKENSLHGLFAQQVERTPDSIAAVAPAAMEYRTYMTYITYRELNNQSNRLAHILTRKGIQSDTIVGIMMERSVEMIIGILAILKSGGAYLPIDPDYPRERIDYMLKDSGAKILLKNNDFTLEVFNNCPKGTSIHPSTLLPFYPSNPSSLAYIIYTSGSTGQPKGVMMEHTPVVNILSSLEKAYPLTGVGAYLLKTSYLFDVSVTELFGWFFGGGRVVILPPHDEKDPGKIMAAISRDHVTHINFVPSMFDRWVETLSPDNTGKLAGLKYIFLAGEVISPGGVEGLRRLNSAIALENLYGPTEAAVYVSRFSLSRWSGEGSIPIGKPLPNVRLYILDHHGSPRAVDIPGELFIGGIQVARGYLNHPELTAERFNYDLWNLQEHHDKRKKMPGRGIHRSSRSNKSYIYRTGDLARWQGDGNIEFLGRMDHQVKIRGFRIELGEIENQLLTHRQIKEAVVTVKENPGKEKCLYAFIVPEKRLEAAGLRAYLSGKLPGYMIPSYFVQLEELPLTPAGKVDRQVLPGGEIVPDPGRKYAAAGNDIEKTIAGIWREILGVEKVGIHDHFFEAGGNSFSLIRLNSRLKDAFQEDIPVTVLFDYPTIASLARFLGGSSEKSKKTGPVQKTGAGGVEIAVIGMSGRFPGASNIREFWENIANGIESIEFLSGEESMLRGIDPEWKDNSHFIPAKGILEDKNHFDAMFFGYSPAEAGIMDPQVRIFHECCWEALENAGYDPETYQGSIGLYAGASPNPYWEILPLRSAPGKASYAELWEAIQFSDKDYLGLRIAYKLDLKGPCITVQTACSTSLAAVGLACQGLLNGAADMTLAGGVSITFHDEMGYLYQEGTIMSADGHCRPFDSRAGGTVGGNGAGVVVLKPLEKALEHRDTIYAVIKGFAVNNDGKNKTGFTAPGVQGQVSAIRTAVQMAGVEPQSLCCLETHGTGTPLGDPIEIEALKQAFTTFTGINPPVSKKTNYCALGSVKANIGHLDAAAGIAGLIKTVLILTHRSIPPMPHFQQPNPAVDIDNSPFYVNTRLKSLENNRYPLRAGVSSFGLGGTNVHVVLEEFQGSRTQRTEDREQEQGRGGVSPPGPYRQYQLILLSARTQSALDKMTRNLRRHFEDNPGINLADAAYTLQVGRKRFLHRGMLVCPGHDTAAASRALESGAMEISAAKEEKPFVIFMFPGQGSQYVNMGLDLYKNEPLFRQRVEHGFHLLQKITGRNMKPVLYPDENGPGQVEDNIYRFRYATPIQFIFEYSLAKLLMNWGIRPAAMIGHSFGEYAAACLSGVFSFENGLFLAAWRGELMHRLPPGAMLSVPLSEEKLIPLLHKDLTTAAVNTRELCVISGPVPAVQAFEKKLNEKGHECLRYQVPKAGHSRMVEPVLAEFKEKIKTVTFKEPQIPYISGLTGTWITTKQALDPGYWTRHLRETIRFADGLTTLYKESNPLFIQVGAGRGLTLFALQHPDKRPETLAVNLVRHRSEPVSDVYYTLRQTGRLWMQGVDIHWKRFYENEKRYRVPLPSYPFEGIYFPVDKDLFTLTAPPAPRPGRQETQLQKKTDPAEWFYQPSWERVNRVFHTPMKKSVPSCILIFVDIYGLGLQLKEQLEFIGADVVIIVPGKTFEKKAGDSYVLAPVEDGYKKLFTELANQEKIPRRVIYLWSMGSGVRQGPMTRRVKQALNWGFYGLLFLVRALAEIGADRQIGLEVVTGSALEVTGQEKLRPENASVHGLCRVIPQEYPHIHCRCIDMLLPVRTGDGFTGKQARQLLAEFSSASPDPVVAFRGQYRWVQTFKPLRLERPQPGALPIRRGGVYLITGGTGAIGLVLARHLAASFKAKMILTGRSDFPPGPGWDRWLSSHPNDDRVSKKIRKLQEIEASGGEVLVLAANAAHPGQMQEVVQRAQKKWGTINGVIHAAGMVGEKAFTALSQMGKTEAHLHFQPKVFGLLVLARLFKHNPLDFCLFMSSTSAVLGGLGFGAYSAANFFMDAYIHYLNRSGQTRWISIDWDGWQLEDQPFEDTSAGVVIKELAMTPAEGVGAFERALACKDVQQVIQCTGDLQVRLDRWVKFAAPEQEKHESSNQPGQPTPAPYRSRSHLSTPYTPPNTRVEKTLATVWSTLLGVEQVGAEDNFFELNGDSLKAVIAISKIHQQLKVKIPLKHFFLSPTIRGLAHYITAAGEGAYHHIKPVEKKEYYPLSPAQQRMFLLNQLDGNSTAYNIPTVMELRGALDIEKLKKAFTALIRCHESLRTCFLILSQGPVQVVKDEKSIGQWSLLVKRIEHREIDTIIRNFIRPFDLSRAPLLRVGLYEWGNARYILVMDIHHIVSDGSSMGLMVNRFMKLYGEEKEPLPLLAVQYKDYACWLETGQSRERLKRQAFYWLKELPGEHPVMNLPLDFRRPRSWDFAGGQWRFEMGTKKTRTLKKLAKAREATLYLVLLSLYMILLSKITGQEDIIVGAPVAGRGHKEVRNIIGMFVNTLVIRGSPTSDKPWHHLLLELKTSVLSAFENQDYPFDELVKQKKLSRETGRNPLFDTAFILQNLDIKEIDIPGLHLKPYRFDTCFSKLDLALIAEEINGNLCFTWEYRTALFRRETIRRWSGYFQNLADRVLLNPAQPVGDIDIISEEEKIQVLFKFNQPRVKYAEDKTLHRLFAEKVEQTPDRVALAGQSAVRRAQSEKEEPSALCAVRCAITYRELNEKSRQLACLLQEKGVQPDTAAAIKMERSVEMIIGILGILKAGGAYMPIDPEYPEDRIDYMLKDSSARILLTSHEIVNSFGISNLEFGISPRQGGQLAYIIYTSGTTGWPKGVLIQHRGVVNMVNFHRDVFKENARSRMSQAASPSFDAMAFEVWPCLLAGACLCIVDNQTRRNPVELKQWLIRHQITISFQTTMMAAALLDQPWSGPGVSGTALEILQTAGDRLTRYPSHQYPFNFYNLYGPTEDTVWTTWAEVPVIKDPTQRLIPPLIGKPVANHQVYIFSRRFRPQPPGLAGQLLIAGVGLARGYLNNPELTAEKFDRDLWDYQDYRLIKNYKLQNTNYNVQNSKPDDIHASMQSCNHTSMQYHFHSPHHPITPISQSPIYKTGDSARWLENGNLEFLGRLDEQIKIRGFRIEPGEVENRLLAHKHIDKAVVMSKKDKRGEPFLCAYIVSHRKLRETGVKDFLSNYLPDYMVPSYIARMPEIPLTPGGKIDREALPEPGLKPAARYRPPGNEIEKKLVGIWNELLTRNNAERLPIGIDDNFFEWGGNSFSAALLASRVYKEFQVRLSLTEIFKTPFIRGIADYIKRRDRKPYESLEPVEKKDYYVLSSAQKRLYLLQQMESGHTGYNLPMMVSVEGYLDREYLGNIFSQLIQRHEILRSSYDWLDNEPVQRLHEKVAFKIEQYCAVHGEVQTLLSDFVRPFDLSKAPLVRAALVCVRAGKYILAIDMHHIAADGFSHSIFIREFTALYQGKQLKKPAIQYKDFSEWQYRQLDSLDIKKQEKYWLKTFQAEIPVLDLLSDFPRSSSPGFAGDMVKFSCSGKKNRDLKRLCRKEKVTLFMVLLSIYYVLLFKYTGREDMVVGIPVFGRRHPDLQHIIGMFVNMLAMRNRPAGHKTFREFLEEVNKSAVKAFENQDYPFNRLVERTGGRGVGRRNPLFDAAFVLENQDMPKIELPGLVFKPYPYEHQAAKFDIALVAEESENRLNLRFDYSTQLFKHETIEQWARHFKYLVSGVLENPGKEISGIEMISPGEKRQILYRFNRIIVKDSQPKVLYELFEEQVQKTPDSIALTANSQLSIEEPPVHFSYRELSKKSGQLAYLLNEKGVGADTIVGVMMERSLEMIIALLGILKSGGAYLPIDPDYPEERINYMLADSNAKIVLTLDAINCVPTPHLFSLKSSTLQSFSTSTSTCQVSPANLAYVIYTSGTTGRPKGVLSTGGGVVNTICWRKKEYRLGIDDRVLQLFSFCFDGFVTSFFTAIVSGAAVVLLTGEEAGDAGRINDIIRSRKITHFICVPSLYKVLLEVYPGQGFSCLRMVTLAGEVLPPAVVEKSKRLCPQVELINEYGATENTVVASIYRDIRPGAAIPIGKPIANTNIFILDGKGHLTGIGVPGELCIAGTGVARGYLNQPELTCEKFDRDLWDLHDYQVGDHKSYRSYKSYILYKTGDLARWLPGGNIEFLGRIDYQVKIRGYRIETGEIENQLLQIEHIKEAVVIDRVDTMGNKYLCAYIVTGGDAAEDIGAINRRLARRLSAYMIPTHIVQMEKIPLTSSGKIDRKALPEPRVGGRGHGQPPGDPIEEKLAAIWLEVLGSNNNQAISSGLPCSPSTDQDFFQVGGDSLKAAVLVSKIHHAFHIKVPLSEFFKHPGIRELAQYIRFASQEVYVSIHPIEEKEYYPLSPAQKRMFLAHQIKGDDIGDNITEAIILEGQLDRQFLELAFKGLIRRHDAVRTSFYLSFSEPVQRVHARVDFKIHYHEFEGMAAAGYGAEPVEADLIIDRNRDCIEAIIYDFIRPYDLSRAPLLRVKLVKLQENYHMLLFDMHHIVFDGVSAGILLKEWAAFYEQRKLPALRVRYKDFTVWQAALLQTDVFKKQEAFWLDHFSGQIPTLRLPTDYPRPSVQSFEGNNLMVELDKQLSNEVNQLALEAKGTIFMVCLSVFYILLYRYSGQEDIVIGSPAAGRPHDDLENVIGMFVNMLPLRNYPRGEKMFKDFFQEVKNNCSSAYENQDYQFDHLLEKLGIQRNPTRNPLFDVVLAIHKQDIHDKAGEKSYRKNVNKVTVKSYKFSEKKAQFDIVFYVYVGERISLDFRYCQKLFKPSTAERMVNRYIEILEQVTGNPGIRLKDINISFDLSAVQSKAVDQVEFGF